MRHFVRARELKAAGRDWTDVLTAEAENRRARLVAELLASVAYATTAARAQAFVEQGGGCRATFFNYRRKLGGGNRSAEERTGSSSPGVSSRSADHSQPAVSPSEGLASISKACRPPAI
jgi:hypothetical protein